MTDRYYTTSTAFLEALAEAGVKYVFANLGSDHPGIVEALAQAKAEGRERQLPALVVCPHETVALSAAHAYAMVTGEPQAVVVHVDSGTQNIGGAVNNAMRGRVPVLIFAGMVPFTQHGELAPDVAAEIATALAGARNPLIVTSYLGRDPSAVPSLVELAELLAIPVVEAMAYHVNFPAGHPLHAGWQYHSVGVLGPAAIRHAGLDGRLRQPGLGRAEVLHPARAPVRGGRHGGRLPCVTGARGGLAGSGAGRGRRIRGDGVGPGGTAARAKDALDVVHGGRSAVVSVRLPSV